MPQKTSKPIDRLPIICAAGRPPAPSECVGNLFRDYTQADLAEKIVKSKERFSGFRPTYRTAPIIPDNNQLRDILAPDLNKSRFLEFKDQFYENLYCKKVPLGKALPTYTKPDHITNENVTFGKPNPRAEPVYTLVLPEKSPDEVRREYVKWHDKYRLSHSDFYPSERLHRGYNRNFNPDKVFGHTYNVDNSGVKLKSIIEDFNNCASLKIINKTLEEFIEHNKPALGKPLKRMNQEKDPNMTYGRSSIPDECNVRQLLNSTVTPEQIREFANVSTYRAFTTDIYCAPVDCLTPAGSIISKYPRKGSVKFMAENLGEETSAKQLISPSIPTHFGLSHRDFLLPRPKEQIKRIFTKAGYDLSNEELFEKVWNAALTEWTSLGDQVSIEAFKYALKNRRKIETESK